MNEMLHLYTRDRGLPEFRQQKHFGERSLFLLKQVTADLDPDISLTLNQVGTGRKNGYFGGKQMNNLLIRSKIFTTCQIHSLTTFPHYVNRKHNPVCIMFPSELICCCKLVVRKCNF